MPPTEETVLTPDPAKIVVELVPAGDDVDVEEPLGRDVDDVKGLELEVEEPRLVVEDDGAVLAVDVVALMTGAPGASLT